MKTTSIPEAHPGGETLGQEEKVSISFTPTENLQGKMICPLGLYHGEQPVICHTRGILNWVNMALDVMNMAILAGRFFKRTNCSVKH